MTVFLRAIGLAATAVLLVAACGDSSGTTDPTPAPGGDTTTTIAGVVDTGGATEPPQDENPQDDDQVLFKMASAVPVVERGAEGEWDARFTGPGAVIHHDGKFHMFRSGFENYPTAGGVNYLTSADGISWTEEAADPIFSSDMVEITQAGLAPLDVEIAPDGTWIMYWVTTDIRQAPGFIGFATAPGPMGPWESDATPILEPGPNGSWDDLRPGSVSVIQSSQGWLMFYSGLNRANRNAVGLAFSDDGFTWTKYDDPTTSDALYAESDPVLVADSEWEVGSVTSPDVIQTDDGFLMIYSNKTGVRSGLARSVDGVIWEKYALNPVFDDAEHFGNNYGALEFLEVDGTYYLWTSEGGRLGTDIWLATYEGEIAF